MEGNIGVAIVALVGSVTAAVFAWAQAARTARLTTQTELQIAAAKEVAERRKRAFDAAQAEAGPIEAALEDAWRLMQRLKDGLSALTTVDETRLRAVAAEVINAADALADGYTEHGARLTESTRRAWHQAKSLAVGIAGYLTEAMRQEVDRDAVMKHLGRFLEARQFLSDTQAQLAAERAMLRYKLAEKLAEIV